MQQSTQICSFNSCSRPLESYGLCRAHRRQQREGRALRPIRTYLANASIADRIAAHSERIGSCIVWVGAQTVYGQGQLRIDGRTVLAYRAAYELAHGPIPAGSQVDHMCHRRECVNVEHLQLVNNKENNENIAGARRTSKTGIRGVCWDRGMSKWRATAVHNGKQYRAGYYESLEAAERAAINLRNELFSNNLIDRGLAIRG